jgi:hypothetical protein
VIVVKAWLTEMILKRWSVMKTASDMFAIALVAIRSCRSMPNR